MDKNQFENVTYACEEGLIMGNPLSPLLAEIFIDEVEHKIHQNLLINKFLYWYGYVDDILGCYVGTYRQLDNTWNCFEDVTGTLELLSDSIKSDVHQLKCKDKRFRGKFLLTVAKFVKDLRDHELCNKTCDCHLVKVVSTAIESSESVPIISVNCSGRNFAKMPQKLPNYTRILDFRDNQIDSMSPLKNNPEYRHVWDVYLDNNKISSIGILEGSYWLSHFRTLSLKGNNLRTLPCYALDNAFMKNPNMPILRIYLGGNPWRCDCAYTPVFQELVLQKYNAQVRDTKDVRCAHFEREVESKPIIELTRSSMCRLPMEYSLQQGLDLLNAVLASLIVFVLGKLAYDYYHFKKSGKLPWIIMKMS